MTAFFFVVVLVVIVLRKKPELVFGLMALAVAAGLLASEITPLIERVVENLRLVIR